MYESYWQLDAKPFENVADPRFYYPGEAHQGALLKLRYAIENQRGAALLAGASGTGKTLLVESLRRQLPETFSPIAHLVFPQLTPTELLSCLADELGAPRDGSETSSTDVSIRRLRQALTENTLAGRHAVVIVDEAHLLEGPRVWEALRMLLNFTVDGRPALTLLLVGQPALLPTLDRLPQLEERLGVKCLLRPLTLEETVSYVTHRLTAAGARRTIFEPAALEAIHEFAHGIPRRINRLGDLSLLIGFAEEQPAITAAHVEAVCQELVAVAPD